MRMLHARDTIVAIQGSDSSNGVLWFIERRCTTRSVVGPVFARRRPKNGWTERQRLTALSWGPTMVEQSSLGQVVRNRRLALDWSQEELADRISIVGDVVRQSEISRLELGKVTLPRRPRLERIAAVLGVPIGELLARSGWFGADAALSADPPPTTLASVPARPIAPHDFGPERARADATSHEAEVTGFAVRSERLRQALARSRELRAQSAELRRRTSWAVTLIEPTRSDGS